MINSLQRYIDLINIHRVIVTVALSTTTSKSIVGYKIEDKSFDISFLIFSSNKLGWFIASVNNWSRFHSLNLKCEICIVKLKRCMHLIFLLLRHMIGNLLIGIQSCLFLFYLEFLLLYFLFLIHIVLLMYLEYFGRLFHLK